MCVHTSHCGLSIDDDRLTHYFESSIGTRESQFLSLAGRRLTPHPASFVGHPLPKVSKERAGTHFDFCSLGWQLLPTAAAEKCRNLGKGESLSASQTGRAVKVHRSFHAFSLVSGGRLFEHGGSMLQDGVRDLAAGEHARQFLGAVVVVREVGDGGDCAPGALGFLHIEVVVPKTSDLG